MTTVLAADNARRTLETGVTTVRDLGASNEIDYAMRDLINMGRMVGPRMFVAGQGLVGARATARSRPRPSGSWPRRAIAAGSDWIKIFGSRGSYQSVDTTQTVHVRGDEGRRRRRAREEPPRRDSLLRRRRA